MTRLNDAYTARRALVLEKTSGAAAAQQLREDARNRKVMGGWSEFVDGLNSNKRASVVDALKKYAKAEQERTKDLKEIREEWRESMLESSLSGFFSPISRFSLEQAAKEQYANEAELLSALRAELSDKQAKALAKTIASAGALLVDTENLEASNTDTVFVLEFEGDTQASQVTALSNEVSTILSMPRKPTEVLLKLGSPGGTVTGYGLAAAELNRLVSQGIQLTVCIDQLAASGGYLMACVANKILCSPYAAIGSIGVISQLPNVAERLEREGIDFIQTTAGKWKRTVTPFKKPTEDELAKQQEDIMMVFRQFADTVATNRPNVTIEEVATGEVWFGREAVSRGLVDGLTTSSDYIQGRMQDGAELFLLKQGAPQSELAQLLGTSMQQWGGANNGKLLSGLLQAGEQYQGDMLPQIKALPLNVRFELVKNLLL